jgi:predicted helicase
MMFVPYVVAILKLSKILKREGFNAFSDQNRLQIFLTNTLDLEQRKLKMSMPLLLLEEEHNKAEEIKNREDILVILGNPPYNNKSKNRGKKILELLDTYKQGLKEKKINLDDDYIKFIRFAQWKLLERPRKNDLLKTIKGAMGFITNNSFIWGRTHRKMRESLYNSFDEIYILNLHGADTDHKDDKNVFDIQRGVCISFFIKYEDDREDKKVFYYSTQDNQIFSREDKFKLLDSNNINSIEWKELEVKDPYYWFIDKDLSSEEYESDRNFWGLNKVFKVLSNGNQTLKDDFVLSLNKEIQLNVLKDIKKLNEKDFLKKYNTKNVRDWTFSKAKEDVIKNFKDESQIVQILYRPFDARFSFFSGKSRGYWGTPSASTYPHILNKNNLILLFTKALTMKYFAHSFIANQLIERGLLSSQTSESTYQSPLYIYQSDDQREPNFTYDFKEFIKTKPYSKATPEQILGYIYAMLYTPSYREKYYEYLKIDYPKIPFTDDKDKFYKLSKIGLELIDLHLMKKIPSYKEICLDFTNTADKNNPSYKIKKLSSKQRYKDNTIFLNDDLYIRGITEDIWNYKIGSYQVLDKWLKYRIDHECSKEDLEHFENICKILKRTIEIQIKLETQA